MSASLAPAMKAALTRSRFSADSDHPWIGIVPLLKLRPPILRLTKRMPARLDNSRGIGYAHCASHAKSGSFSPGGTHAVTRQLQESRLEMITIFLGESFRQCASRARPFSLLEECMCSGPSYPTSHRGS